jgi:excisionase family DNA binding protein
MMNTTGHVGRDVANDGARLRRPQFFTVRAIAERLDVSSRTVHRWIKNNGLVVHRVDRSVRVSDADLKLFLAAHRDGD